MALTTRTIPSIYNGISKQPAILRSPDQTEAEVNTWGQIAFGVGRRPPTKLIAELNSTGLEDAFVHHINRDINERYVVLIDEGVIRVFDHATGDEKTVTAPGGLSYLSAPGTSYRAITVADYTFIVNTATVCQMEAVAADHTAQPNYYIWAGGANTGIPGGVVNQYGVNPAGTLTGSVQKFEDLPTAPATGAIYKVSGSVETAFVSYYVRWSGSVWDEAVAPGLQNSINALTMPHALVRQSDGTFVFGPFSWRPRRVGDGSTNPAPPFVGRSIRDVFFYQNRLAFLTDESAVFSVAGDYGDYWRRTVLDYIESDVIAAAATTTDVALLDYAVPFNDGVMLFSAQRQFSLSNGESGLSATSISIDPVTSYVTSPGVRPAPLGSQVYFASDVSGYTTVQEYVRLDGSDATDAAEITSHVPGLLPTGASQLVSAPDINAIFTFAAKSEDPTRVYPYQFFWGGDRKLVSAWRVWDFGEGRPVSGTYLDGRLHIIVKRGTAYYLEAMDLSPGAKSASQDHLIYLDRQVTLSGVYDPSGDRTTFTFPYVPDAASVRLVRTKTAAVPESLLDPSTYVVDGATVSVPGHETAPVTAGESYPTLFQFSQQFPQDYQGRPLTTGRLQLHTFTVNYTDTAFFKSEVRPYGTSGVGDVPVSIENFNGQLIGSSEFLLGKPVYRTGSFTFSVAGEAKLATVVLRNETPYASTWVSAEWEGLFFSRAFG